MASLILHFVFPILHFYIVTFVNNFITFKKIDISFCDDLSLVFPAHWLLLEQFISAPLISGTTYEIYIRTAERQKYVSGACDLKCEKNYFTNLTWLFKWILAWVKNNLIKSWFLRRVGHWFIVWKVKWRAPGLRRKFGHKFTHIFYFHHFC